ncbi:hypothetical protein, partial [Corynebacterium coyleae]
GLAEHQHLINALLTELIRILTWHDLILPDRWVSPSTGIMTPQPKFTMEQIQQAVSRASRKVGTEYASIEEFDEQVGRHASVTTVHLLVQLLLASLYGR